jgi:hypothetical protein
MVSGTVEKNIRTSLEDADWYLQLAEKSRSMDAPHRVTVSMCIRSMIKGTDALCFYYTGERCRSGRGHSLHNEFSKLYTDHGLPEKNASYRNNIKKWVAEEKTRAEYRGQNYSSTELSRAVKQSRRYLENCVRDALRSEEFLQD